jgi:hypothetical protein
VAAPEPAYTPAFVKRVLDADAECEAGNCVGFESPEAMSDYILSGGKNAKEAFKNNPYIHRG